MKAAFDEPSYHTLSPWELVEKYLAQKNNDGND